MSLKKELSLESISIIKDTAEMVVGSAPQITKKMFEIIFDKYPDIKEMFKNQPKNSYMVLAESLSLFIVNIEKLDKLIPALEAISIVHVEHNIRPVHYPKVGMALMSAMEDVLQEKATVEFIDAWREAYKFLSDMLIDIENEMYKEVES